MSWPDGWCLTIDLWQVVVEKIVGVPEFNIIFPIKM